MARNALGPDYDVATHFTPSYNPWDQRLCLVPDSDLFQAIRAGQASVVTGHIETFKRPQARNCSPSLPSFRKRLRKRRGSGEAGTGFASPASCCSWPRSSPCADVGACWPRRPTWKPITRWSLVNSPGCGRNWNGEAACCMERGSGRSGQAVRTSFGHPNFRPGSSVADRRRRNRCENRTAACRPCA